MKRKLPEVYVNKIKKQFKNNNNIFYSAMSLRKKEDSNYNNVYKSNDEDDFNVNLKIKEMFNSPYYIYKIGAWIYTKDGKKLKKEVIGEIDNKLITLDEEYIPIEDIKKIEY